MRYKQVALNVASVTALILGAPVVLIILGYIVGTCCAILLGHSWPFLHIAQSTWEIASPALTWIDDNIGGVERRWWLAIAYAYVLWALMVLCNCLERRIRREDAELVSAHTSTESKKTR
jgi:hypothetical protein